MSQATRLYVSLKVLRGFCGTVNLGISTAFLLQKPVTFFELGMIYSLILGVAFFLEYPSGNLADRHGRKRSFAFGVLATAVQYAFFAAFSNVLLLYFAGAMGGLGDALISGSLEAWLGEEEKRRAPDRSLHHVFGLSRSLTFLFSIIGSLGIGLLVQADLTLVYWGGAIILCVAALAALVFLPDNRGQGKTTLDFTRTALKVFVRSPALIFLALILAGAFACYSVFILYWQPQAQILGVSPNRLPLLYSVYLAAAALSSYLYARLAKRVGVNRFIHTNFALIALSFTFMALGNSLVHLGTGLFCFGLGFGSIFPLFFDWATDIVPSALRASMLSLMNAVATAASVLITTIIGEIIERWGLEAAVHLGLGLTVVILLLLRLVRGLAASWEAQRFQVHSETSLG